ncbi:MAG: T9SS type A sorting domain-containing protein [Bacteroidetes bacterium]|nr:T9SS type A sorting domain-containing protein [Bacteroidota bacterium]
MFHSSPCKLLVLLFLLPLTAVSQPTTYHKVIPAFFTAMEVLPLPDHGFIHAGLHSGGDGCFIRTDSVCTVTTIKYYDIANATIYPQVEMNHLLALPDSSYISVGVVANPINSRFDGLLMNIDVDGNVIWSKRLGQAGYTISLYSAALMADSGFVFCGTATEPPPAGGNRFFVGRMDKTGNLLWSNTYSGGNNNNFGRMIKATPDGGCIFTGYFEDFSPFVAYAVMIKLDAAGAVDWARKISTAAPGFFISGSDVLVLPDGYILYGMSNPVFVSRTDLSGNLIWTKEYSNVQQSIGLIDYNGNRIYPAASGGYLLIAGFDFFGTANRLDTSGNAIWSSQFYMRLYNALETDNGEWHFTGAGPLWGVTQPQPDAGFVDLEMGIVQSDSMGMPDIFCMMSQPPAQNGANYTSVLYSPVVNAVGSLSPVVINVINDSAITVDTCVNVFGGFEEFGTPLPLVISPNPGAGQFTLSMPEEKPWQMTVVNSLGQSLYRKQVQGKEIQLLLNEEPDGIYLCRMISSDGKKIYQGRILKSGR